MMVFSKQKMIERVTKAGHGDMLDDAALAIMDNLDGQPATPSCWERVVNGEPVLWCVGKDGEGYPVHENDVEYR